jgi:MoaA/NifB/PqqE/SkfB family radical SAM enzyme
MNKTVRTPTYKYNFDVETGFFQRWGKTVNDDPQYSPIGPEILDISISSICHGGCQYCYQSNTPKGKNMSLETFKIVLDKMSGNLTQIAMATGDIDANPDLWAMMEYARNKNIVPNITISGYRLTDEIVCNLRKYVGAVAVSHYDDDTCFNAVKRLTDTGLEQVNIHQMLSKETYQQSSDLLRKIQTDARLSKLNAVVFLSLKQKGRGVTFNRVTDDEFKAIVDYALDNNIRVGFDSCGSFRFLKSIVGHKNYKEMEEMVEPCESALFSSFVNVDGMFSPCSFMEGVFEGIDVVHTEDFLSGIWFNPRIVEWRKKLLSCKRSCPIYNV